MKNKKIEKAVRKKRNHKVDASFLALLNPICLKTRINYLGLEPFSALKYIRFLLIGIVGLLALCFVVKLKAIYTISLILLELILMPSVYYIGLRNKY